MDKLTDENVQTKLTELPQWSLNGDSLQRTFGFDDFVGSMACVSRIADLAEQMQHRPGSMLRYSKVTLTLSTHDAGGLTESDFSFAHASDAYVPATEKA